jgi:23S rRNA (uracil1939-C5)-methyltransferase
MMEGSGAVEIVGVDLDGDGVGEVDGRPVHVPFTIPGERAEVVLRPGRDGGWTGEVVRLLTPSPHRVPARCRHFGSCGGCSWQHIAYPEQLRLKQRLLQTLLDRALGRRSPAVLATLGTPESPGGAANGPDAAPWGYRDKVHFVFGRGGRRASLVMGHYRRASRTVLPIEECPVHAEAGNRAAFALRDALVGARVPASTPDGASGVARHAVVRVTEAGDLLTTLVVTENVKSLRRVTAEFERWLGEPPGGRAPGHAGFHLNIHDRPGPFLFGRETRRLFGEDQAREAVAGVTYLISPTSFFQTNARAAGVLVRQVVSALPHTAARVLDLYAGVGLFALPLARRGHYVVAVEENREAVASAAAAMGVNRVAARACRLIAARVEDAAGRVGDGPWDAVVLDPPRQGCAPAVLDWIVATLRPSHVVYVSCNPEALARDLASVPPAAYAVGPVQPVDMFPHTAHLEAVVVLNRTR